MLRTRVLSAAVLILILAPLAILGGLPFLLLVTLIGILAAWELAGLFRQSGLRPSIALGILLTSLLILQAQWPNLLGLSLLLTVAIVGSLVWALFHDSPQPASDWAVGLAGALYLGWMLNHFVRLRALPDGLLWLLTGALAIWAADVVAYFAGRAIGRHPWWPRHSPKKTWEGYLAGVAAGTLTVGLLGQWALPIGFGQGAVLGLLIAAVAPLGDLAESMIKRQAGAKDSSRLIPGHGGVLDRIDSLLIAIPLTYYWATLAAG